MMQSDNKTMPIETRPDPIDADREAQRATDAAAGTADAAIKEAYIADTLPPEREAEASDEDEDMSSTRTTRCLAAAPASPQLPRKPRPAVTS